MPTSCQPTAKGGLMGSLRIINTFYLPHAADGFIYLYDENGKKIDSLEIVYLGDVDFDGDLDYDDLKLLSQYAAGYTELSEKARLAGNMDRSRRTDSIDAALLAQLLYDGGLL